MLRKLLPIGTLLLLVAAAFMFIQAPATADPWKDEAHQYERRAPRGQDHWVPPGHRTGHHKWVPPGHRKHGERYHDRYDRDRDRWDRYDDERWDRDDRRYRDERDWRYQRRKHRDYDRDSEDYGLIIRKGPHGTTVDIEYNKRDW